MDMKRINPEVATEVVRVYHKNVSWKFFGAFVFIALISFGLYFSWDSSFVENIKTTSSRVFGMNENNFVEVINLNDMNSSGNRLAEESEVRTIVVTEDKGTEPSVDRIVDFSGIEIVDVVFDVEGSDRGEERVTIRNAKNLGVDISGGSIQYVASGDDFSKIKKKNFGSSSVVGPYGVFVIGMNCHADAQCVGVDTSWSQALNNTAGSVFIVSNQEKIIDSDDVDIVSRYDYILN